MKKLITTLAIILMASPAFAIDSVEETKAKVKVGPVKANVKNSSDTGNATITRAGDTVILGCTYSKVVVKGIKSSATAIAMSLSFDSVEGDFEAGQTYDLSHSNPTALTSVIAAARSSNDTSVRLIFTGAKNSMYSAPAIESGTAKKRAINEVTIVPVSIGPIENSAGITPSPLPAVQLVPVINFGPMSRKISTPRANRNSPMSAKTSSEVTSPAVTTRRKMRSPVEYTTCISRFCGTIWGAETELG